MTPNNRFPKKITITTEIPEGQQIEELHGRRLIKLFLGECVGVRLVTRGPIDNHICFEILVEDDGMWGKSSSFASSYWIPELMEVMQEVYSYLQNEQVRDQTGFGWMLK